MAELAAGLQELETPFRATLELRYRRGLPDDTIAAVAGFDEDVIQRQRKRALVWLAQRTAVRGPDAVETVEENLRALSPAGWAGEPEPQVEEPAEPEDHGEAAVVPPPVDPPTEVAGSDPEPDSGGTETRGSFPPPSSPEEPRPEPEAPMPLPSPQPFSGSGSKPRRERTQVSTRTALGLLALLAAVIALIFILSSGDSGEDAAPAPAVPADTEKQAGGKGGDSKGAGSDEPPAENEPTEDEEPVGDETGAESGSVAMEPVPGADLAGGRVEISMSGSAAQPEIELKLDGLPEPDGEYRGWLYDSVIDSRSLGRARSGDGVVTATLPDDWERYPFLDLSLQEPDSIVHSGESIARIPLSELPSP